MKYLLYLIFLLPFISSAQTNLTNNLQPNVPKPLDNRTGKFVSGQWIPYVSTTEANTLISSFYRHKGMTVLVSVSGVPTEYWYRDSTLDASLIVKSGGGSTDTTSLSNRINNKLNNTVTDNSLKIVSNVISTNKIPQTISIASGSPAMDRNTGFNGKLTLTQNATLSISNAVAGDFVHLDVYQDGTGDRTLTVPTQGLIILQMLANGETQVTGYYDGTNWYWTSDFQGQRISVTDAYDIGTGTASPAGMWLHRFMTRCNSGHGFKSDDGFFPQCNGQAYAAFDAQSHTQGSFYHDHFIDFQSRGYATNTGQNGGFFALNQLIGFGALQIGQVPTQYMYGLQVQNGIQFGGTKNWYGVEIDSLHIFNEYTALYGSSDTNAYSLHIRATKSALNNWGIVEVGSTGKNFLGSPMALNSVSPDVESAPNVSTMLDIVSTTKGLGLPAMTKTQRDAISSPRAGLAIYQTDNTPGLRVYNGTNWMKYTETTD